MYMKMTLDELRHYVETMPEGVVVIVEFKELNEDEHKE